MLKLSALLRLTDPEIERRGRQQCSVKVLESLYKTDNQGKHKSVLAAVVATTVPRTTCIKFYDSQEKNLMNSRVWVHCSCQNFKYVYETVDAQHKSSSIILSDGQRPSETNPRMIPALCKHLVALAAVALVVAAKDPEQEALKKKQDQERKKQEQIKKQQDQKDKREALRQKAEQDRVTRQEQQKQIKLEKQQAQQPIAPQTNKPPVQTLPVVKNG